MCKKIMRTTAVIFIIALVAFFFAGCSDTPDDTTPGAVKVTGVSLTDEAGHSAGVIWLGAGAGTDSRFPSSVKLSAVIEPSNAANKNVTWSVNTDEYVNYTVMPDKVSVVVTPTALGGPTAVTVTTKDGNFKHSYTVTVADPEDYEPVTNVEIVYGGDSLVFTKTGNAFNPPSIQLGFTVTPPDATVQTVTWSVAPAGVVTVSPTGLVTPLAVGTATVTLSSDEDDDITDTIEVTVTEIVVLSELVLYNQAAPPSAGTTTDLENAWDDTTKKYTINNAETGARFYAGAANTGNNGVVNTTIVYLNSPVAVNSSISARVRITNKNNDQMLVAENGVIMGLLSNPTGDVHFMGIRASTSGLWRVYQSRTGNTNSSSALSTNASSGYGERSYTIEDVSGNQYASQINGVDIPFDEEFILEFNRTSASAFTVSMKDYAGNVITTGTNAGSLLNIDPAYIGFIIANAEVEISQISIKEGSTPIFSTANSAPTPTPAAGVEFTAPADIAGNAANGYTYTHSTLAGNSLTLTARALPARAPQVISWAISGATPAAANTASVEITVPGSAGTVTATASAGGKSAALTITVTAGAISVQSITVEAEGGKNSIMAGDGAVQPQTLHFTADVSPGNATNKTVTWSVHGNAAGTASTTAAAINAASGLLTAANTIAGDTQVWVFAAATDGSGVKSAGTAITVKPYAAPPAAVWEFNAGDVIFSNASTVRVIDGINTVRAGGTYEATSAGIPLPGSSRFVVGYGSPTYSSGSATANNAYVTNGELDLSKKFTLTVEYSAGAGTFLVWLQNNQTSNSNSVFGSACVLINNTTWTSSEKKIAVTVDPASLNLTTQAVTAQVDKNAVLSKAFLQFRTDGGSSNITITRIAIEYTN